MLIFERSRPGRTATAQLPAAAKGPSEIPSRYLRRTPPLLPECSELDVVRHYTSLSQKNFSIDTHFYPLGSCTMKYNPRACNALAMLPPFLARHPDAPDDTGQGFLSCLYELQEILKRVTGMAEVSLAPLAGAQGEFTGVAMIRAYHDARRDSARREILVPNAAHGTNPASAVMCGYAVREIATDAEGNVDLAALEAAVGAHTAGLMLTNPSTLGVFERHILEMERIVHEAGGLLYSDGANLNAQVGGPIVRDRVWGHFAYLNQQNSVAAPPAGSFLDGTPFDTKLFNYTGKATYQMNQNNKFIGYLQHGTKQQEVQQRFS